MAEASPVDVAVRIVGDVAPDDRDYAIQKVQHATRSAPGPVLFARLELRQEPDPARPRPAVAKGELDCNGQLVRAHVAAATQREAADLLEARLRQSIERVVHRDVDAKKRHRDAQSWHHGDAPTRRPAYFPRPTDECEVVVRKSFAIDAETVEEAMADLELLDHDFFLFRDLDSDADCVVARNADGYAVQCAGEALVPTLTLEDAEMLLDETEAQFVFFVDPGAGRGRVLYRRYDGHYGLIVAVDDAGP